MKTADLTGATLSYWVARARKLEGARIVGEHCEYDVPQNTDSPTATNTGYRVLGTVYAPREDWNDCGPLIEEFGVELDRMPTDQDEMLWQASPAHVPDVKSLFWYDADVKVAICRAVVASVFGEEVEDAH